MIVPKKIEAMSASNRDALKQNLLKANEVGFDSFFDRLARKLDRLIKTVVVLPLFGDPIECKSISDAVNFIESFKSKGRGGDFRRYELRVVFSNDDEIKGSFSTKDTALEFLRSIMDR